MIKYPDRSSIRSATDRRIVEWFRSLPSPGNKWDRICLEQIFDRWRKIPIDDRTFLTELADKEPTICICIKCGKKDWGTSDGQVPIGWAMYNTLVTAYGPVCKACRHG